MERRDTITPPAVNQRLTGSSTRLMPWAICLLPLLMLTWTTFGSSGQGPSSFRVIVL